VNGQRPIEEIRAEHPIVCGDDYHESVFQLRRFTGTRRSQIDLSAGRETLQKSRADESSPSAGAVKPDVVEAHNANVRVLDELPLQLVLHRPVNAFVKDIRLDYVSADEFGNRSLAGVAFGRGHCYDRFGPGPVISEQNCQRSGHYIGAVRVV